MSDDFDAARDSDALSGAMLDDSDLVSVGSIVVVDDTLVMGTLGERRDAI